MENSGVYCFIFFSFFVSFFFFFFFFFFFSLGPSLLLAPFAFYCSGAIGGVFVLLLAVALQMVSIYCLVVSAHLSGRASYRGLTSHFIGQGVLPRLADLVSFLFAVAVCLLHFTVARDLLPFVVAKWVGYEVSSFFLLPIFTLVLVVPVALLNRMALFFVPSIVSLICLLYLLGALIYAYSSSTMHPLPGPVELEPVQLFRWS
jgi:amino acid permease